MVTVNHNFLTNDNQPANRTLTSYYHYSTTNMRTRIVAIRLFLEEKIAIYYRIRRCDLLLKSGVSTISRQLLITKIQNFTVLIFRLRFKTTFNFYCNPTCRGREIDFSSFTSNASCAKIRHFHCRFHHLKGVVIGNDDVFIAPPHNIAQ